jgi:DNA-binding LytR/AlgR family response regulator
MKPIKCIIIDDEPIAIEYLREYVNTIPELLLIGTYQNAKEALPPIQKQEVDLIFIDIEMPEISGLEFVKTLENAPAIIFTTAYPQYAVEGFNLNAVDYLLKPIGLERFKQAIQKVHKEISIQSGLQPIQNKFIFLKNGYKSEKIDIQDIIFIAGNKEYATYYTKSGRTYLKNERLKNLEKDYQPYGFIRIHKSYLINTRYIKKIFNNNVEIQGETIPIGRAYREQIRQLMQ